jgi:hypothetical protein
MVIPELTKELNLVFDEWDNEVPLPNGNKIFPQYNLGVGEHISQTYNLNVEYFKLEDVKKNSHKKFFYIIEHTSVRLDLILSTKMIISDVVLKLFRECENLNILFLDAHESYLNEDFSIIKNVIEKNKIDENRFYIINNNHLTEKQVKKNHLNIKYHANILIPIGYVCSVQNKNIITNFVTNKIGKFFICLNNMKKIHRLILLSNLKKIEIIDDVNWSYRDGDVNFICDNYHNFKNILNEDDFNYLKNDILFFNNIKLKNADFEKEIPDLPYIGHISEIVKDQENSYVNIVSESLFLEEDVAQITEKSLKPFFYYQLPIFCATHHHVRSFKEKYDFDLFSDIINHDYDDEFDNIKRMKKLILEIKRLDNNKEEIKKIYPSLKERMELNKIKLFNILKNKDDENFIKNMCNE